MGAESRCGQRPTLFGRQRLRYREGGDIHQGSLLFRAALDEKIHNGRAPYLPGDGERSVAVRIFRVDIRPGLNKKGNHCQASTCGLFKSLAGRFGVHLPPARYETLICGIRVFSSFHQRGAPILSRRIDFGPGLQQKLRQFQTPIRCGEMQRSPSEFTVTCLASPIDICAVGDELGSNGRMICVRNSKDKGIAPATCCIRVGAAFEQRFHHGGQVRLRGSHQRGLAVFVGDVKRGPGFEQRKGRVFMAHEGGKEKRRAVIFVEGVELRSARQQFLERLQLARVGGIHQGCLGKLVGGLDIHTLVEKGFHLGHLSLARGLDEGGFRRRWLLSQRNQARCAAEGGQQGEKRLFHGRARVCEGGGYARKFFPKARREYRWGVGEFIAGH